MGVGCLGIKKGLRTGQRERPGVGLLRETGIGSSPHMTIRGSEELGKSQAIKNPAQWLGLVCQSVTRKIDRMDKSSLTFSLIAMAFCYAA